MAAPISKAKIVSSFIVEQCSLVARRGYASSITSQGGGVTQEAVRGNVVNMMKKGGDQESNKSTAWIPDPVTGYYKPEGHENRMDPAELRDMLLKHKTQRN